MKVEENSHPSDQQQQEADYGMDVRKQCFRLLPTHFSARDWSGDEERQWW